MSGFYEHFKARPGNAIPTGALSAEVTDRWKNKACQVCEKITDTCDEFWDHLQNNHHITSNNVATFHEHVQKMKNRALEPDSIHFIVSIAKCAQTLGLIEVDGCHDIGAQEVTVLTHLDPLGRAIVIQATFDLFLQAILKKVALHFLDEYRTLIQENWNITKKVKLEIKQEFAVKQEPVDQLDDEIKPNEQNLEPENVKKEPVGNDRIPRTKITEKAIANETKAFTTGGKDRRTPDGVLLAIKALAGSAQHRYILKQKREWLNLVRIAVNMIKLRLKRRLTLKLTNEVKRIRQAHKRSKAVFEVNWKKEIETSVEIGKKKGTECPSISVVPERKPANTTDAQNSDHVSFMMEYRRTRKVIEEYYKNKGTPSF